jgi:glycosyltransferase involved in cell wall biosynthesis
MPLYNCERYLQESVDSVLNQTYDNLELIIIDDGSTDKSAEIIQELRNKDQRVIYSYQTNQGPGAARNKGIELANGEYISFIDSDDIWFPDKIEQQLEILKSDNDLVVYGGSKYIWEGSNKNRTVNYINFNTKEDFLSYLAYLPSNRIAFTCAVICHRKCLDKVGNFNTSLSNAEDLDLWLRLAVHYRFFALQRPVFYRRKHDDNQTSGIQLKDNINNELVVFSELKEEFVSSGINYDHLLSEKYRQYAGKAYMMTEYGLSRMYLAKSIRKYPYVLTKKRYLKLAIKILFSRFYG